MNFLPVHGFRQQYQNPMSDYCHGMLSHTRTPAGSQVRAFGGLYGTTLDALDEVY